MIEEGQIFEEDASDQPIVEKIPLKDALPFLAPVILALCEQYHKAPKDVQWALRASLALTIRNCERYVVPRVSVAAHEKATELGLADLRTMSWRDQRTKMKDPDRSIFHFEHIVPVFDICQRILALSNPTTEAIEELVAKSAVAWILKTEDAKLPRTKRQNPYAIYASRQIELLPE